MIECAPCQGAVSFFFANLVKFLRYYAWVREVLRKFAAVWAITNPNQ